MSNAVQEIYEYLALGVNFSATVSNTTTGVFGGFICTTAGNFTLQDASGNTIIAAMALVVGQNVLGALLCPQGLKVVLSAGCAGTLLYLPQ